MKKMLLSLLLIISSAHAASFSHHINLMTYNIACLPSKFGIQINKDILEPNIDRVNEIINVLLQWNKEKVDLSHPESLPPDIIAFEESFDHQIREDLKAGLSSYYPYNSGSLGEKFLNAGSGLLFFSKYPILEITFHPYTNLMAGEEWLADKGYLTAKIKYDSCHFFTVIATHLEAGGAIDKDKQSEYGTTSFRRGEQMGHIYAEIETNAYLPPKGFESMQYIKTIVMGDFNTTLNSERQEKSISTGMSSNGYQKGEIKYPGQNILFSILHEIVPSNFVKVRIDPTTRGQGKVVDPALLQYAIQTNQFTGTTLPVELLKKNKTNSLAIKRQDTEYKVIDGIFASQDGIDSTLTTSIFSLNEKTTYPYQLSDHFSLFGEFQF